MRKERRFDILLYFIALFQVPLFTNLSAGCMYLYSDTASLHSSGFNEKSIYPQSFSQQGKLYNFLWGKHYRHLYTTPITVTSVHLNNLYGGLNIIHHAPDKYGVFLENNKGNLYLLRILGGYSTFIESGFFRNIYNEREFKETYLDRFIKDAYTITHPYSFVLADRLASRLSLSSFNPEIYYIPPQSCDLDTVASGAKIEDRLVSIFDLKGYDAKSAVIDTDTLLKNIKEDKSIKIDNDIYIRERLFDMLVGDWNKGNKSWRWEKVQKEDSVIILTPIVYDRQSAFTKVDGFLFKGILGMFGLNCVSNYDYSYGNLRKNNDLSYTLDVAIAGETNRSAWSEQAKYIKTNLTDNVIDDVFELLPQEIKNPESELIKAKLKTRRNEIDQIADRYYDLLQHTPVIVATQGNDSIVLNRNYGNILQVEIYDEARRLVYQKSYDKRTKEIWIYGLAGNDYFKLFGKSEVTIPVILIGGKGQNIYNLENKHKVTVYEYKSHDDRNDETNGAKMVKTDLEKVHAYDFDKLKYSKLDFTPWGVYDSDLGLYLGAYLSYTMYGFKRSPYSYRHRVGYNYLNGFMYQGLFPTLNEKRTYTIEAFMGTPGNFLNFFGFGNETDRFKDAEKIYNRVNVMKYSLTPSFNYKFDEKHKIVAQASFELYKTRKSSDKYVNELYDNDDYFFKTKTFADLSISYLINKKDISSWLSMVDFSVTPGWKINLRDSDRNFFYLKSDFGINLKITDRLTYATQINGTALFGDKYEFYHAATADLRGYRKNRFLGKKSLYQYSDIRLDLGRLENPFTPLNYGIFAGGDYGRVWYQGEDSKQWHTSCGGGFWITLFNNYTGKFSYFSSKDGGRFEFRLGLDF